MRKGQRNEVGAEGLTDKFLAQPMATSLPRRLGIVGRGRRVSGNSGRMGQASQNERNKRQYARGGEPARTADGAAPARLQGGKRGMMVVRGKEEHNRWAVEGT